jgi:glyoxylase-like metal-dependent hydrolase (beta-lactamase superfamily II)
MDIMTTPQTKPGPGFYVQRVGDVTVTAISDGYLDGTLDVLRNIEPEEARRILAENFRPARRTAVNAFLVQSAGRTALIETGSGSYLQPTAGRVLSNIMAGGFDPAAIDTILLTHMHPDHSAGLTNMSTGQRNYTNAQLVVHANEPKHWFDDALMSRGTEREKKLFFQAAREQVEPYRAQMRTFESGDVFPGVTAMPAHGHTPGHTMYLISSGNQQVLIWGDIVHVPEVQTLRPEVCMDFDTDKAAAEVPRRRVFDMVATDRMLVTGMHLHFPGFSHLIKQAQGYRLIPAAWEQMG